MHVSSISILAGFAMSLGVSVAAIPNTVTLRDFFGLTFNRPLYVAEVPGRDSNFVVVEQLPATGTAASVIAVRRVNGTWTKSTMVTVTVVTNQNQMGLLGFAFHPQFHTNRKYYLSYNPNAATSLIVERVADTSFIRDGGTAQKTILRAVQPQTNQNGGGIGFGPDGFLYIGFGDGGGNGDPQGRAQNMDSLMGKMLRVDVDGADAFPTDTTRNYAIPSDNPFVGGGHKAEVWAYGLRNPWRWSFHPVTGELWAGDVGQGNPNTTGYEEISRITKGGNMGWPVMEGAHCYPPGTATCNSAGMIAPAQELTRTQSNAVIGGMFFSGNASAALNDVYFYGDNASGRLWGARADRGGAFTETQQLTPTVANLSSFGMDSRGRLFALRLGTGTTNIASNTGAVMILESPDMVPSAIRSTYRNGSRPIARSDLMNPGKYSLRSLDGRGVGPGSRGVFIAVEKNSTATPRLVPLLD
jgi:glucose/arabinose dehydrogenase